MASQTITEERSKQVNFSQPYYISGPQVFSREKGPVYKLKNKELAVSKGSTYQKQAVQLTSNVKIYDSDVTALEALARGRHDAVITDLITGMTAIKNGLKIYPNQSLGSSDQGISVAKENTKLLARINQALNELQSSGAMKKLSLKYFGRDITRKTAP